MQYHTIMNETNLKQLINTTSKDTLIFIRATLCHRRPCCRKMSVCPSDRHTPVLSKRLNLS